MTREPAVPESDAASSGPADEGRMTFMEHLAELRQRLIRSVVVLAAVAVLCFGFAPDLFEWLRQPLEAVADHKMIVLGPLEMFITYLKLAALAALFLSSPWILLQVWGFVAPGLYQRERRWVAPFVLLGTVFFVGGGAFAFYVVMPLGFDYLVAMVPDAVEANYSVAAYFTLVTRLLVAFGVVFELPLAMCILSAAGVVDPGRLARFRKYWIVVAVALAAFLTPPDPFTQLLMAIPLVLFFEVGILGARLVSRRGRG